MFKKDTENYDIGRIDVYMRSLVQSSDPNTNVFLFKNYSLNGFKVRSRFGLTMAKLGDINDDGFNGTNASTRPIPLVNSKERKLQFHLLSIKISPWLLRMMARMEAELCTSFTAVLRAFK